jgi:alpha-tubulin suppressor-like RCC1 family protein
MKDNSIGLVRGILGIIVATIGGTPFTGRADSEVVAWGWNDYGQTDVPSGLRNVVAIAAGGEHSLALTAEGQVMAWGDNHNGQTDVPSGLSNVVAIAAGATHNLALTADGQVVAWGGARNRLGSWPNYGQVDVPGGLSNVVAIAAGVTHSLALTADGRVVGWGDNYTRGFFTYWSGQAIVPAGLSNIVAIAAGYDHSMALAANGQVVVWGNNDTGQLDLPGGLSNVVAIAAGNGVSMAMTAEGGFLEWGWQGGQSNSPSGLNQVVDCHGGIYHTVVLTAEGRLLAWGGDDIYTVTYYDVTNTPSTSGKAVAVAAGDYHNLALIGSTPGVAPPAWMGPRFLVATAERPFFHRIIAKNGVTTYGAVGLPPGLVLDPNTGLISGTPAQAGRYNLGLSATNSVGSVGWNVTFFVNEPAAPGIANSGVALPVFGEEFHYPVVAYNSPESYGASGLPAGLSIDEQSGVISGVPLAFGDYPVSLTARNRYGVGTASVTIRVSPVIMGSENEIWLDPSLRLVVPNAVSNVVAIAAGSQHYLALTAEGRVVAWGSNEYRQTDVPNGLSNVVAIAAGDYHNLVLTSEGRVLAWGAGLTNAGSYPDYGQSQVPAVLSHVVAIAAGEHSLALRTDGTVVAWGRNDFNEINVPSGLNNVVAIAAGVLHSLALRTDGTVIAWGRSDFNEANVPSGLSNVVAIAASGMHNLALTSEGIVVGWGNAEPAIMPGGWGSVVAIAAGPYGGGMVLTAEGRMLSWDGGAKVAIVRSNVAAFTTSHYDGWLALLRQPTVPTPRLELSRGMPELVLQAHGAAGISCQLLLASRLLGPWLPAQPFAFTNSIQLMRTPDSTEPAQFFRLLRK